MDVNLAEASVARVDESVRRFGGSNHDVACTGDPLLFSEREGRLALKHDEDLAVAVPVQARPFSRSGVDDDHRHAGADLVTGQLEAAHRSDVDADGAVPGLPR